MHCRVSTPKAIEFKSKLGFDQYDITLTKEQSVLRSIMDKFKGENMQTQYSVLSCRTDFYFHVHKLTVEVDENDHNYRDIDYEIKTQKGMEKERDCGFVRINSDRENFIISKANNKIFTHIKESIKKPTEELTKNILIGRISRRLLELKFESNSIESSLLERIVGHIARA